MSETSKALHKTKGRDCSCCPEEGRCQSPQESSSLEWHGFPGERDRHQDQPVTQSPGDFLKKLRWRDLSYQLSEGKISMQNLVINLDQVYNLITAFFDCIWNKRTNYKLVRGSVLCSSICLCYGKKFRILCWVASCTMFVSINTTWFPKVGCGWGELLYSSQNFQELFDDFSWGSSKQCQSM